jgi:hypothetical protein
MGIFGEAAVLARRSVLTQRLAPADAWRLAMPRVSKSPSTQLKVCPKTAFLGLCDCGAIKGIRVGSPPGLSATKKNGRYAAQLYQMLKSDPGLATLDKKVLWAKAVAPDRVGESGQVDVVLTLWSHGLLQ